MPIPGAMLDRRLNVFTVRRPRHIHFSRAARRSGAACGGDEAGCDVGGGFALDDHRQLISPNRIRCSGRKRKVGPDLLTHCHVPPAEAGL